jgi:hypothetical protein
MRKHHIAIVAAIMFAFAGFAAAQQTYFNPEIGNGKWAASQPAVSPAYAQTGLFNPEIGNVSPDQPVAGTHEQDGRTGKLDINKAVQLGGTVLKPGEYMVRHVNTGKTHFVEFSKQVENDNAPEGTSVYENKVVARVHCTMQPVNTPVAETGLSPKSAGTTAQLAIRGEKTVHLF